MNNGDKNKSLVHVSRDIQTLKDLEQYVEVIAKSESFSAAFKQQDGNINRDDILSCLVLGAELGISPMKAIALGKTLNREAITKVERGKDLGINWMSALNNIFIWRGKSGAEIVYCSYHVVMKVLHDAEVKIERLEDAKIVPVSVRLHSDKTIEVTYNEERHVCLNFGLTAAEVKASLEAGKIPVVVSAFTKRSTVRLTRGQNTLTQSYTLKQATEAQLYRGTTESGDEVKGKDNWNCHPETHLFKQALTIAARIIVADRLQGMYVDHELPLVRDVEDADAEVVS